MRYEIRLHASAFSDLAGIPGGISAELQEGIRAALDRLSDDPVKLGEKPVVPYPVLGQIYPFVVQDGETSRRLVAIFIYGEDERTLNVLRVRYERIIL